MARSTSAHLSSQAPEVSADTGEPGMTAKMDTLYAVRQQRSHHLPISPLAEKLLPNCVWVVGGWMDGWMGGYMDRDPHGQLVLRCVSAVAHRSEVSCGGECRLPFPKCQCKPEETSCRNASLAREASESSAFKAATGLLTSLGLRVTCFPPPDTGEP